MTIEIDYDVIQRATKCERDLNCLSGDVETLCTVTEIVPNQLYILECVTKYSCDYRVPFGDKMMCICPVRQEIYNRYGVGELSSGRDHSGKVECPVCGHRLQPGTLSCTACGADLATEPPAFTEPLPEDELPASEAELRIVDGYESAALPATATALCITIAKSTRKVAFSLPFDEICIGRSDASRGTFPDLDLTADGGVKGGVSRHHARILHIRNHLFVEDVGSANGTFLNHQRLAPYLPHLLREGDTLQLGRLRLCVEFVLSNPGAR